VRVLLVDDSPGDRALSRREIVRALPHAQIAEAGSSQGVENAMAGGHVTLAVIDYSLGWFNCARVLDRVRGANPSAAAILFTGSLGEEGAVEAMKSGFDDYVLKGPAAGLRLRSA
jgi:DNA-binding NarL/FixJ family response regulator